MSSRLPPTAPEFNPFARTSSLVLQLPSGQVVRSSSVAASSASSSGSSSRNSALEEIIRLKLTGSTWDQYFPRSFEDAMDDAIDYTDFHQSGGLIPPEILIQVWSYSTMMVNYSHHPPGGNPRMIRVLPIMEFVMLQSETYLDAILQALDLPGLISAPIDIKYNLIWYLHITWQPNGSELSPEEKRYISTLSIPALQELLGPTYTGPTDMASLIFALLSGNRTPTPNVNDIPRYQEIRQYPPEGVWALASKVHRIFNVADSLVNDWPPHVYVALQDRLIYEGAYMRVNSTNVADFLARYQIVSTSRVSDPVEYFRQEISYYTEVLTRPKQPEFPLLIRPTLPELKTMLMPFTLNELATAYPVAIPWAGRMQLMSAIRQEQEQPAIWRMEHRFRTNDDTMNVIEMVPHGEMNLEDPENPTLSYGVVGNYRCYQVTELICAWRTMEDGTFCFGVPDYQSSRIDPVTGAAMADAFPTSSILQLHQLLNQTGTVPVIQELQAKIQAGLLAQQAQLDTMTSLKFRYAQFSESQQTMVRIVLVWTWCFGWWMRFWGGPGARYPISIRDMMQQAGSIVNRGRMMPDTRDEHSIIQHEIYAKMEAILKQQPEVNAWINELPQGFTSDWENWRLGNISLITYIHRLILGACQASGSTYLPASAYYLITRLLCSRPENLFEFNQIVSNTIPLVNQLEHQVVVDRLQREHDPPLTAIQKNVLQNRLRALTSPFKGQPEFSPQNLTEAPDTDL